MDQSRQYTASVTGVPSAILNGPIIIFKVSEHITSGTATVRSIVAAIEHDSNGNSAILSDWQLIERLNAILKRRTLRRDAAIARLQEKDALQSLVKPATLKIEANLDQLDIKFAAPEVQLIAIICPSSSDSNVEEALLEVS